MERRRAVRRGPIVGVSAAGDLRCCPWKSIFRPWEAVGWILIVDVKWLVIDSIGGGCRLEFG
jgi:hypothetical protein